MRILRPKLRLKWTLALVGLCALGFGLWMPKHLAELRAWVRMLRDDGRAYNRFEAAREMARLQHLDPNLSIPALLGALDDPNPVVRLTAATTLGRFVREGKVVAPALIARLKDERHGVRSAILGSLADLAYGDGQLRPTVVPALIGSLRDDHPRVRLAAARGLARLEVVEEAVPALCELSRGSDRNVRFEAVQALFLIGPGRNKDATPAFLARIGDPDPMVRVWAARGLKDSHTARALAVLIEAVDDEDGEVANNAVAILSTFGPKAAPAVPVLVEQLERGRDHLDYGIVVTLGKIGPAARVAGPELTERLRGDEAEFGGGLAMPTLKALALIAPDDPEVIAALERIMRRARVNYVQSAARAALNRIEDEREAAPSEP